MQLVDPPALSMLLTCILSVVNRAVLASIHPVIISDQCSRLTRQTRAEILMMFGLTAACRCVNYC